MAGEASIIVQDFYRTRGRLRNRMDLHLPHVIAIVAAAKRPRYSLAFRNGMDHCCPSALHHHKRSQVVLPKTIVSKDLTDHLLVTSL